MVFKTAKNSGNYHLIGEESEAQKNKVICRRLHCLKWQSKNSEPDLKHKSRSALAAFLLCYTLLSAKPYAINNQVKLARQVPCHSPPPSPLSLKFCYWLPTPSFVELKPDIYIFRRLWKLRTHNAHNLSSACCPIKSHLMNAVMLVYTTERLRDPLG